jgi:peptidoglycan/xylan/chitin deacetylase (PgdA/CDA1 family)
MTPPPTVLAYHAIGECDPADDPNNLFVTPTAFAEQMQYLADHRRVVTLAEAIAPAEDRSTRRRARAVAITFDDGYRSVVEHGLPVLEAHGFPATMFVPTRYVGDANRWNPPCPCGLEIMNRDELCDAERRGLAIESHGHAHLDLTNADEATATADLGQSITELRGLVDREPEYLAFPFSHGSPAAQRAAKDLGLLAAFSIDRPGTGPFDRPRVQVTRFDGTRAFAHKTSGHYLRVRFSAPVRASAALSRPLRAARRRAHR